MSHVNEVAAVPPQFLDPANDVAVGIGVAWATALGPLVPLVSVA
jgi:hypothetical protein